ncbi:MAG: hypothetical protein IT235_08290 [Bacteroidia bacterium]|nr:hypothetical protein [Bacteroidia bacterium]
MKAKKLKLEKEETKLISQIFGSTALSKAKSLIIQGGVAGYNPSLSSGNPSGGSTSYIGDLILN